MMQLVPSKNTVCARACAVYLWCRNAPLISVSLKWVWHHEKHEIEIFVNASWKAGLNHSIPSLTHSSAKKKGCAGCAVTTCSRTTSIDDDRLIERSDLSLYHPQTPLKKLLSLFVFLCWKLPQVINYTQQKVTLNHPVTHTRQLSDDSQRLTMIGVTCYGWENLIFICQSCSRGISHLVRRTWRKHSSWRPWFSTSPLSSNICQFVKVVCEGHKNTIVCYRTLEL